MSSSNGAAAAGTASPTAATSNPTSNSTSNGPSRPTPQRADSLDMPIPDEAPPSYDTAISNGDLRVAAGPSRMDFSGPPPMPEGRQEMYPGYMSHTPTGGSVMPGVGVGYGPRRDNSTSNNSPRPPPVPVHPSVSQGYPGASARYGAPSGPPPPRPQVNTSTGSEDRTPTETPVPGRPLLRSGNLLVYPKGYWCSKCQNTGYKYADPSNPCTSDWRKYGKPFNSALAHSYAMPPRPGANGTTTEATNFQRPLPATHGPTSPMTTSPHGHYPPQPYPNVHTPHSQYRPPPPPRIQYAGYGAPVPGNALYVQPGDPRIGGRLCNRCGGSGVETTFSLFIFDETQCRACRGLGRVF